MTLHPPFKLFVEDFSMKKIKIGEFYLNIIEVMFSSLNLPRLTLGSVLHVEDAPLTEGSIIVKP